MRRSIYLFLLVLIIAATEAKAQSLPIYFSPGIKLGYNFHEGFVLGLEASVSAWPSSGDSYYGVSLNIDWIGKNIRRIHLGPELGNLMLGAQFGPTLIQEKGQPDRWGATLTCYTLLLAMPFVSHTWGMGDRGAVEIGLLGKYPIEANDDRMDIL